MLYWLKIGETFEFFKKVQDMERQREMGIRRRVGLA